jgi:hypothetical protein
MTQRTPLAAQWRSILLAIFAISLFACSSSNEDDNGDVTSNSLLLNFTSNEETGELRWMNTDSESFLAGSIAFYQDSKVIANNGRIFVLERINWGATNNLNCIDPQTIGSHPIQRSLEAGSNPYDIAFAGNKGFIALYGLDYLQSFDAATCTLGEKMPLPDDYINGENSISANVASIKASGDTLLVILQRLDSYVATKPGLLVRVRTNGSLIDTIQLNFYNPNSAILSNGKLYVSSQRYEGNDVDLEKSGIEVVNLSNRESEILTSGAGLGGGAFGIALDESSQTLYVSTYAYWGSVPVKPVDLSSKSVGDALPIITDASGGLIFDNIGKKLYVGDNSGLKIYNPATGETTSATNQDPDLPPYSLDIVRW